MEKLTYSRNGNYYIPDLALTDQPDKPIGKYGLIRKTVFEGIPTRIIQQSDFKREALSTFTGDR